MKPVLSHALLLLLGHTSAFTIGPIFKRLPSALSVTAEETDCYFLAVERAKDGRCSVEELDKLASELENVDGCQFEKGEEACHQEIRDRLDVAEILRLRIELQLRLDHLKSENLFVSDVKREHDIDERKRFKESLQANRDKSPGSDLGLW